MKISNRKNRQEILYNLIPEINNHHTNRILSKVTDEILRLDRHHHNAMARDFRREFFGKIAEILVRPEISHIRF